MKSALSWVVYCVYAAVGLVLVYVGLLFLKNIYICLCLSEGKAAFGSLLFGVILLLTGVGLVASTVAHSVKKMWAR